MSKFSVLDCTLRDGGYINNFKFGKSVIQNIIEQLGESGVDIIECGFLSSGIGDEDVSLFSNVAEIRKYIVNKRSNTMYVAMLQYGKISNEEIEPCDSRSIDGIRITFHEHEIEGAFVLGKQLIEKGYKIFMQPVGTISYTDEALLILIKRINQLKPYAFYLVDTLGTMYQKDIRRFFYLIDHNLDPKIVLGFHSHNNLQQAFTNAQEFLQMNTPREIIVDATVQGLGRGAGNLCTELILQYINQNISYRYDMLPIFRIIDENIEALRIDYTWGYSAAYYLAATKECHPNYAAFLMNTKTLKAEDINYILDAIVMDKRHLYDEQYIGELYVEYKSHKIEDENALCELAKEIEKRDVVLVAPGKNSKSLSKQRIEWMVKNCYIIGINFVPSNIECNRIFFSNEKRLQTYKTDKKNMPLILSSNILERNENAIVIDYSSYLINEPSIADNAGLMCLNLMKKINVKQIFLVGFDGFEENQIDNYVKKELVWNVDSYKLQNMNEAIKKYIRNLKKVMTINFVTESCYDFGKGEKMHE